MVHPDWSPDGAELLMNNLGSTSEPPSNLYATTPDGSGRTQLTHSSIDGHMRIETPRWDPDGTRLLVSIVYTTGPDFAFGGEVRLAFVDGAGGFQPAPISTLSGKYPDLRPTPYCSRPVGQAHSDALRSGDDAPSETPPNPDRALAEQGRHRRHG